MGHPSMKVVRSLPGVVSSNKNSICDNNCQVCFYAKQPRSSFPLSMNKVSELFALIHGDIWAGDHIVLLLVMVLVIFQLLLMTIHGLLGCI